MSERWFTVEYEAGEEWHLFDGPYPSMRIARKCRDNDAPRQCSRLFDEMPVLRIVEHRVRD